jgi:hypothetical protein
MKIKDKSTNWISFFVSCRETSESLAQIPLFISLHGNVRCVSTGGKLVYGYNAEHYLGYSHLKLQIAPAKSCALKITNISLTRNQ